jgi:hypothetical protein
MLREDLWLVFDLSSLFLLHHMGLEPAVQATISPIMCYILSVCLIAQGLHIFVRRIIIACIADLFFLLS